MSILSFFSMLANESKTATIKGRSNNPIGYSRQIANKTVLYNTSHNKISTIKKTSNDTSTLYNRSGNKVLTVKTK